jgi:hypothetical protein
MPRPIAILAAILSLAAAGVADAAPAGRTYGTYRGTTTQGISVRLAAASATGYRWFRYRARLECNDGSTFLDDYFSDDVTVRGGRFSSSYTSNAGAVRTKVTGMLSGSRAKGTIRIIERYSEVRDAHGDTPLAADGAIVCDSGVVRWAAKA